MLASASNAIVVGFNTKITDTARRAAEAEGVDVRLYDIIYQLTDDIEEALSGLLEPEIVEVVEGRAEVRQIFKVGKSTVIAGSYVTDGRIVRGGARVWRGGKVIATDKIESLRRFRDDVREVADGFECGIGLAELQRPRRRRHHRVLHLADGQPRGRRLTAGRAPADDRSGPTGSTSCCGRRSASILDARRRGPADRVRDDHRRRDGAGPAPRQGLGQRHRPAGRARRRRVAALGRAMPFVRHELGTRLRIKRIPELHVQLDDTAERGTRVLQLLDELEAGGDARRRRRRSARSLPTPVARLPHEGDLPEEPPSAARQPEPPPATPTAAAPGRARHDGRGRRRR